VTKLNWNTVIIMLDGGLNTRMVIQCILWIITWLHNHCGFLQPDIPSWWIAQICTCVRWTGL